MNMLTTFMNVAYRSVTHSSGTPHYFNDTEFFREFYSLVLGREADVIDLGFNIGMQADIILPLTTGQIFGFEASPKIYQFAREKFAGVPAVKLFNCAVSDAEGRAGFIDTDFWGAGSLRHTAGMDHVRVGDDYSVVEVELKRLDDVLADQNNIGLIKLDIEGAEFAAIEGARKLIDRNRPFIVMEYAHNALSFTFRGQQITRDTLFWYAAEIGYKVYNIYGICLSNPQVWATSVLRDTADVYLIPEEQHARWATDLLPVYQYKIYDKILEALEWDSRSPSFFALTALPSRIYEVVNTRDADASQDYLSATRTRLVRKLGQRKEIFETKTLSRRGEVLLGLLYDGEIDAAYRLACIKDLSEPELARFEEGLAG